MDSKTVQRSALCGSRRLAKFGFDTAENEPCKVCPLSAYKSTRLLMEADAALFDECSAKQRQDTDRDTAQQEARDKAWGELTARFNENAPQELKELCIRPKIPDINADGSSNLREF